MLLLSSSNSSSSIAFLLALLVANQLVDARGFAGKSAPGSGTEFGADSKEGTGWTDGPMSMTMSINLRAENIPVVGGESEKAELCTQYSKPATEAETLRKCQDFLRQSGCDKGDLKCPSDICTCCCV